MLSKGKYQVMASLRIKVEVSLVSLLQWWKVIEYLYLCLGLDLWYFSAAQSENIQFLYLSLWSKC